MRPRSVATHYRDRGVPIDRVIGRIGYGQRLVPCGDQRDFAKASIGEGMNPIVGGGESVIGGEHNAGVEVASAELTVPV